MNIASKVCIVLVVAACCSYSGPARAVNLLQQEPGPQACSQICNYERLGIKTYVQACMQGCKVYQNAYFHSGDRQSSLATCKADCSSSSRAICVYGCSAAQRAIP